MLATETETRREKIWKALAAEVDRKYVSVNNKSNIDHRTSIRMENEAICIEERKL